MEVIKLGKVFHSGILKRKKNTVIKDVSFRIEKGKTLGLVGKSGSGKSTIARLVLRLIDPTSGCIRFNGSDITRLNGHRLRNLRKEMQIVFQNPETALNPKLKLISSIAEPLRIHGLVTSRKEKNKIHEMAAQVDLTPELLNRYPHQLSGGQIQRAVLARVLCLKPRLMILDEPTSMLDVSYQAQILRLLKKLQKEHEIAYLFISHDPDVVGYMSDDIAVLHRGRIFRSASKDKRPATPVSEPWVDELMEFAGS